MSRLTDIIGRLAEEHTLSKADFIALLGNDLSPEDSTLLADKARSVANAVFGRRVRVRNLLEVTNVCRNNCLYCGLRRDNKSVVRYSLSDTEIIDACAQAYEAGFRTFVLQGGENPALTEERISRLVAQLRASFPAAAITLSLGEWPDEALAAFRMAGADRYLLRHETFDSVHYAHLHPTEMSRANRLRCLYSLKRLGYQTGTGIMVGSPGQTPENIADDLIFMSHLKPEMIGIGPFIPHSATPFGQAQAGSIELTVKLISILRLMFPDANIPATTALSSLHPDGRRLGIEAGANVVMSNITPAHLREAYAIYDGKLSSGAEAAEGLQLLRNELSQFGYAIDMSRGDYQPLERNVQP